MHFIVAGGGLSPNRSQWLPSKADFFVPVEASSPIFRAKFRDALKKTDLFDSVPADVWQKDWVVHCKSVGDGNSAMKYLALCIYRIAITNNRIEKLEDGQVSFQFKNGGTDQWQTATVPAAEFIHRFLQSCFQRDCQKASSKFAITDFYHLIKETCWRLPNTYWATPGGSDVTPMVGKQYICPNYGAKLRRIKSLSKSTRAPP
jgi:hypothetical protein